MTELIAFYSAVKGSVDKDRVVEVISMGFTKAFDSLTMLLYASKDIMTE